MGRNRARCLLIFFGILFFTASCPVHWGWVPPCRAGELERLSRMVRGDRAAPWRLEADEVFYRQAKRQYEARGNVAVRQYDRALFADRVVFNAGGRNISAEGNVTLRMGEDVLKARAIEMDLATEKAVLYEGEVYLKENHFILKGDRVEQTRPYQFSIENAMVTTCDGDTPAWRITARRVDVTLNGYGFVRHGTLWSKNVPLFYTPFFMFPVLLDRQSGLLIPKIGVSDRRGFEFDQPVYWAISPSTDATLTSHYMSRRGIKAGLEYRHVSGPRSKGTLMVDFLEDREIDEDGKTSDDKYGYDDDAWERTNSKRYWFRMKADRDLGGGVDAMLDLDIVSDQDFLLEFRDGHSGFHASQEYYQDVFGRILDSYEDPVRVNQLNVNKSGAVYTFNSGAKWYDNVIARRYLDDDTTVQNLPWMRLSTSKQPLFSSPFFWRSDSEFTYLYSRDGTRGQRLDVHPRLFLPKYVTPRFSVGPWLGVRETAWWVDDFQKHPREWGKDRMTFRHLIEAGVDARSELYRIYAVDAGRFDALSHSVIPRIVYRYISDVDQDEHPWFGGIEDEVNRVEKTHRIALGVTQYLTARSATAQQKPPAGGPDFSADREKPREALSTDVLFRFELMQGLDIDEARASDPADYRNGEDRQPFLPLEADLEIGYGDMVRVSADARWNHYENRFSAKNLRMALASGRGDRLNLRYRFTEDLVEYIGGDIAVKLSSRIFSYADVERNLLEEETVETGLGFIYHAPCWMFDMRFSDEDDDRKIEFMVTLRGLGEIGNK